MRELIQGLKTGQAHHAYILVGQPEDLLIQFLGLLESDLGLEVKKSPDIFSRTYDLFNIEDSRLVRAKQKQGALGSNLKLFILAINSISLEAENALLKTLEEPTTGSHFFLLVQSPAIFLATVRSRCQILNLKNLAKLNDHRYIQVAKDFLQAAPVERLEKIKTLLANDKLSKRSEIMAFFDAIEIVLRSEVLNSDGYWPVAELGKVIEAKKFISLRGGFPKLVLEDFALSIK